ncbi:MAG: pyridoxal phosphate-dependent aminotransferase [Tannerellaceae bacterium]|jgi:aspartate/methionine/tyrosine aminotransferase|nr:pyridoxal phosphate-dependent aminotransferase [Tannerellaceae bacterium]
MKNIPVDYIVVKEAMDYLGIVDLGRATIREIVAISSFIEAKTGVEFIRMEMGVPGLPPSKVGVRAEMEALRQGVASAYPDINGVKDLKNEASRFIRAFVGVDVRPEACVPVTGSMQGTFASFLIAGQCEEGKDTILFIDPGFPVQKQQIAVMGYKYVSFDVYKFRGEKLAGALERFLAKGNIAAIVYSNPNNPAWICLTDRELEIIARKASDFDAIVIEDLAYFRMDFRKKPVSAFNPPYQASIANHSDNYIIHISGSKIFSYAGQRIGVAAIANKLYDRSYPALNARYGAGTFGQVYIHRILYSLSSGTSHSAQYALAAMFKAASDGPFTLTGDVTEYGRRAKLMKDIFVSNGFHIVYDLDIDRPIADGFYFTVGYQGMSGDDLAAQLIRFGISAISLSTTGSEEEGIRACTSFIKDHQYTLLDKRLKLFTRP